MDIAKVKLSLRTRQLQNFGSYLFENVGTHSGECELRYQITVNTSEVAVSHTLR